MAITVCDPNGESITLKVPGAQDNCDPDPLVTGQIIASDNPGILLPLPLVDGRAVIGLGSHTVEWTAIDDAGNSSRVTQTLSISPAIFVTNRLDLRDRARLETPARLGAAFANSGGGGSVLGVESLVGDVFSVSRVTARNQARIEGDIFSRSTVSLQHGVVAPGSVNASLTALALPPSPSLPSGVLPTLPMTAVHAEPGANVTLPPGAYTIGDFKSRATLSLSTGIYVFDELQLQPQTRVLVDLRSGPVLIVVKRELTNKGTFTLIGGATLDLSLVYLGARETQFDYPWAGRLFAPNGAVVLGSHGGFTYTGQIYAKALEIRPDSETRPMAANSEWLTLIGVMVAVSCACDNDAASGPDTTGSGGNNQSVGGNRAVATSSGGGAGAAASAGKLSSGGARSGSQQGGAQQGGAQQGGAQQGGYASGGIKAGGRLNGQGGASATLGQRCEELGACSAGEICVDTSSSCNGATCQAKKSGCSENTCGCLPATTCAPPGMCFAATNCVYCLTPSQ